MARTTNAPPRKARRKKLLGRAKGYRDRNSTAFRIAKEKVEKGLQYAYRDRRNRKRDFRGLWIQRINAGGARAWPDLLAVHERHQAGRHRDGPQGAGRPRRARAGGLRRDRQAGQAALQG